MIVNLSSDVITDNDKHLIPEGKMAKLRSMIFKKPLHCPARIEWRYGKKPGRTEECIFAKGLFYTILDTVLYNC